MQYHSGDKVYHQIFGDGTVISSTIASSDEEVTVVFPNLPDPKQRVKKLAASLARLAKR